MHKSLNFLEGDIQLPKEENGFQDGALMVAVAAVSIGRVDGRRLEQTDFVVPHQGLFVDAVKGRELSDCQKLVFFAHIFVFHFIFPESDLSDI